MHLSQTKRIVHSLDKHLLSHALGLALGFKHEWQFSTRKMPSSEGRAERWIPKRQHYDEALCARGRGVAKRVQERGHRGGDTQEAGKEVQESPGKQGRKRYSRQMEKHVQRRREAQM